MCRAMDVLWVRRGKTETKLNLRLLHRPFSHESEIILAQSKASSATGLRLLLRILPIILCLFSKLLYNLFT